VPSLTITKKNNKGYSLIELVAVITVIFVMTSIVMVSAHKVRNKARQVLNINNQRQVILALNNYAADNNTQYPPSVATIGTGDDWHWQQPTMLVNSKPRNNNYRRSAATYLKHYLQHPSLMFCPNAPQKPDWFEQFFQDDENWNNPATAFDSDPAFGSYCFYWNYKDFLPGKLEVFIGPEQTNNPHKNSNLLISDYFGSGHWRGTPAFGSENVFTSCEKSKNSSIMQGTSVSSDFWATTTYGTENLDKLTIQLHAGFIDGHVEQYKPSQTVKMNISMQKDGSLAYPTYLSPGTFYLPEKALNGSQQQKSPF